MTVCPKISSVKFCPEHTRRRVCSAGTMTVRLFRGFLFFVVIRRRISSVIAPSHEARGTSLKRNIVNWGTHSSMASSSDDEMGILSRKSVLSVVELCFTNDNTSFVTHVRGRNGTPGSKPRCVTQSTSSSIAKYLDMPPIQSTSASFSRSHCMLVSVFVLSFFTFFECFSTSGDVLHRTSSSKSTRVNLRKKSTQND
ncbi:hypothetical protein CPB85DRAFT_1307347 [Mucidula mucida]|nr:hypothetical protein CPB85DRAFT_1307347 [Mucidula mucida]